MRVNEHYSLVVVIWRPMSANEALSKIPVVSKGNSGPDSLKWKRKAFQIGFVLSLILIPILGIFRIDVSSGFVVLDRQIWFSDFLVVFGFWLAVACSFIMLYSFVGTAFCGWACPQNSFSMLADKFTAKFLGKRALIDWEKAKPVKIAHHKNKWFNWVSLAVSILGISLLVSIIPLLYFVPPADAWAFFTFQDSSETAYSIRWIYMVFVFIAFVNFAVVRQYTCRYMCIYRMWQYLFKTRQTLHIDYDESRKSDCEKCSYCETQCMVGIDPKSTNMFDSCTNCGACISACDAMHIKKGEKGLLRFQFGTRRNKFESNALVRLASFKELFAWVFPVWLIGASLFAWGLWTYQPYHISVYQNEVTHGSQVVEYRANVASKLFEPGEITLGIDGLDNSVFELSNTVVSFDSVGRKDVFITLSTDLEPGIYNFILRATSLSGWEHFVRVSHVVTRR